MDSPSWVLADQGQRVTKWVMDSIECPTSCIVWFECREKYTYIHTYIHACYMTLQALQWTDVISVWRDDDCWSVRQTDGQTDRRTHCDHIYTDAAVNKNNCSLCSTLTSRRCDAIGNYYLLWFLLFPKYTYRPTTQSLHSVCVNAFFAFILIFCCFGFYYSAGC